MIWLLVPSVRMCHHHIDAWYALTKLVAAGYVQVKAWKGRLIHGLC